MSMAPEHPMAMEFARRSGREKEVREFVERVARQDRESRTGEEQVKEGVFTVPGDGNVDFTPVFAELKKAGYSGWWVVEAEQDPAKANPLEYALKARKYIREKSGI